MITILPESENDVLAVTISGRVTTDDDDKLDVVGKPFSVS